MECLEYEVGNYMVQRGAETGPFFLFEDRRFLTREHFVASVRQAIAAAGLQKRSGDDGSTDGGSGLANQGCPVTYYRLFGQGGIVIVLMIGCLGGGGGGYSTSVSWVRSDSVTLWAKWASPPRNSSRVKTTPREGFPCFAPMANLVNRGGLESRLSGRTLTPE